MSEQDTSSDEGDDRRTTRMVLAKTLTACGSVADLVAFGAFAKGREGLALGAKALAVVLQTAAQFVETDR